MKVCKEDGCEVEIGKFKKLCKEHASKRKVESTSKSQKAKRKRAYSAIESDYGMESKCQYFTEKRKKELREDGSYFLPENDYSCVQ